MDLIIPDLRSCSSQAGGAGVDARPRGSHRRRAARLPYFDGPGLGTRADAGVGRIEVRRARTRRVVPPVAARAVHAIASSRVVHGRVYPRHAQHAGLRGGGDRDAERRDHPHRRFQNRSDADRWGAVDVHRFAELGSEGVLALLADSTNIDRRGFTGSEVDVTEGFEEIFTSAEGKIVVAMFT